MTTAGIMLGSTGFDPIGEFLVEPLISVIIPIYNVFPYLREALDSVIYQTWKNLEIILIDDGSMDESGTYCDEYAKKDSRISVIHQENRGLSAARNVGLDRMTGEYVVFLDPDDSFQPEMIKQLYHALKTHQADLAICGYNVYITEGPMTAVRKKQTISFGRESVLTGCEALTALLENRLPTSVWNKLYPRKLWSQLRFLEGHVYEDTLATLRVLEMSEKVAVIPVPLVNHRKRRSSITTTRTIQNTRDLLMIRRMVREYLGQMQPTRLTGTIPNSAIRAYRERNIRGNIIIWAELHRDEADPEMEVLLKAEIFQLAGEGTRFKSIKTKIAWDLFRLCPGLILPIRYIWRFFRWSCI